MYPYFTPRYKGEKIVLVNFQEIANHISSNSLQLGWQDKAHGPSIPLFESISSLVMMAWAMEHVQLHASAIMKNNELSLELCKEAYFAIKPILLKRK